jgi:tetratricopeptide (TPR) repeat protein
MSFDKIKAMRNAEKFLAQGKIRAAINEYKRVVENDSNDFSTLNMLGDLYAKASEKGEAIKCFTRVAEHYASQGFAQKAIAIYNKVSRLMPESLEVSAKLAQLYQMKGSVAEARSHYNVLADEYSRTGRKAEALLVWKQIADLDPNNTDIYLKIADACWQDEQKEEAATAYVQAGNRLSAKKQYEPAITAFSRALEIKQDDPIALKGFVDAQFGLGYADEAAKALEDVLSRQPYNRDIIYLLVDCYLDMSNPVEAEKAVIKLVEREPANYPKLLDVVQAYLREGDLDSATRILSMTSEHMLVGGQAEELGRWINEVLAKDPEQVDALRLLVRYHGWQREEAETKDALERLAEAARLNDKIDDERYAISQLIIISPQNAQAAQRWQELNQLFGETDVSYENPIPKPDNEIPTFESFAVLDNQNENSAHGEAIYQEYGSLNFDDVQNSETSSNGFEFVTATQPMIVENLEVNGFDFQPSQPVELPKLDEVREHDLKQELDSVEFYITQGYADLAEKSLDELENRFGKHEKIEEFRALIKSQSNSKTVETAPVEPESNTTNFANNSLEIFSDSEIKQFNPLDEFRDELGFEESEPAEEGDHETHYHLGIAYKEMGLMEDSIREFQDAVKFVSPTDGTRRFFLCCNLLGHCFMEKEMPNVALMWYKRALDTSNLTEDELQGLRYEIANAYEEGGDREKALQYFEGIYAHNVDYRDVGMRLEDLRNA